MLGDFYNQYQDPLQAEIHYNLAIKEYEKMLERAPELRESIEGIERIRNSKLRTI